MSDDYSDYDNYEITIVVPPEAPEQIREALFDRAIILADNVQNAYDRTVAFTTPRDWDLGVCMSPIDHTTQAALDRALDAIDKLEATVTALRAEAVRQADKNSVLRIKLDASEACLGSEIRYRRLRDGGSSQQ